MLDISSQVFQAAALLSVYFLFIFIFDPSVLFHNWKHSPPAPHIWAKNHYLPFTEKKQIKLFPLFEWLSHRC